MSRPDSMPAHRDRWAAIRALGLALVTMAVLVPLVAVTADRSYGRDVTLIVPHEPSLVELNRSLWSPGEPIAELYGSPASQPVRVLIVDDGALTRASEEPTVVMLPTGGDHPRPMQARTLWFVARIATLALGATGAALLFAARTVRRRVGAGVRATAA